MRCVPKKIIVPMDELNQRDGEGSYFKVWDDVDPFFTHPVEDVAYIPESLHTALCEEQVRIAREECAEVLKNAAIATNTGKSFAQLRRYLLTKREQFLSRAKPEQGGGENGV